MITHIKRHFCFDSKHIYKKSQILLEGKGIFDSCTNREKVIEFVRYLN